MIDEITESIRENRDSLSEESLQQAIDLLNLALPGARKKDLDQWTSVKPSVSVRVERLIHQPEEQLRLYGARLLTVAEFEELKDMIPGINTSWYLDTTGDKMVSEFGHSRAAAVAGDSVIYVPSDNQHGIRPVLEIASHGSEMGPGSYFQLGIRCYRVISDELAICTTHIGFGCYGRLVYDYDDSDIRKTINRWFNNLIG